MNLGIVKIVPQPRIAIEKRKNTYILKKLHLDILRIKYLILQICKY